MRLINDDESSKQQNIFDADRFETHPNVQRLNELDFEINNILNSDIDEINKAKLYSQTLRKFLTYKRLHQEQKLIDQNKEIDLLKKFIQPKIKKSRKLKRPVISNLTLKVKSSQQIKTPFKKKSPFKKTVSVKKKELKSSPKSKKSIKNIYKPSTSKGYKTDINSSDSEDFTENFVNLWSKQIK